MTITRAPDTGLLDTLNPGDDEDLKKLRMICRSVGHKRILNAAEDPSWGGGFSRNGRAAKIAEHADLATLPLLGPILMDNPDLKSQVAESVLALNFDLPETKPLRLCQDAEALPLDSLMALSACNGVRTPQLTETSSNLLARIALDEDGPHEQRLIAISLLNVMRSERGREALELLSRGRRFLATPSKKTAIRNTARHALERYKQRGK